MVILGHHWFTMSLSRMRDGVCAFTIVMEIFVLLSLRARNRSLVEMFCVYQFCFVTRSDHDFIHEPMANTPFTQGLRPLCLPCATTKPTRSPLKAEGRPNGCFGSSRVAHRTFRHRHGRHGRHQVLSMFKTVTQRSPWRSVAHRSLKGGRMKAHTSPWSQNGCTVVGHWWPSKKCEHCVSI